MVIIQNKYKEITLYLLAVTRMELRSSRSYIFNTGFYTGINKLQPVILTNVNGNYFKRMEIYYFTIGTVLCILSCVILTRTFYHIIN
jgi:hypothetical protein